MSAGFEDRAAEWLAWARTPGFDAYWTYRDAVFALVPPPGGPALEVGCGEGRVARDLGARGHEVTGLDASPTLLRAAAEADPAGTYVVGAAEALPFGDATFALVVAYNSLMDVADMPAAVREAARVLRPGGHLCVCVTHPLADAGSWSDRGPDAAYVIAGSYRRARRVLMAVRRDGRSMTFDGTTRPVEGYARALEDAGLLVETLREPAPAAPVHPAWERWTRIPAFLMLRAVKPPAR